MNEEFDTLNTKEVIAVSFCLHPAFHHKYKLTEKGLLLIKGKIEEYLNTFGHMREWPELFTELFKDFSVAGMEKYLRTAISLCEEKLNPTGGSSLEVLEMKLENDVTNDPFLAVEFKHLMDILFPENSETAP